jgi:histidine triad (HIT) family protein
MSDRDTDCIFCSIAAGEADADIVYQDDELTAFRDINPVAPTHVLIIPNHHVESLSDLGADSRALLANIVLLAPEIAAREGVADSGYRLLTNQGDDAGQVVDHLHWHVIGGKRLSSLG